MSTPTSYPVSSTPLQASKWVQIQALLDPSEMRMLFEAMGECSLYLVGRVLPKGEEKVSIEHFLEEYTRYVQVLRMGSPADAMTEFRAAFTLVLTKAEDHLFLSEIPGDRVIARASLPVVQMQLHTIGYSAIENKFRPMVLGAGNLHWGIQLSYPQLFQHPHTKEIISVFQQTCFPNTPLFRVIQQWMRTHTVPTPFIAQEKRINVPMRLGKNCFSWIHEHTQMHSMGIHVAHQKEET